MSAQAQDDRFNQLRAQAQHDLADFLRNEIQLGFTFAEFAVTEKELGNNVHFEHAKADAEKAVVTIRHFLDRIVDASVRQMLQSQSSELARRLSEL